MSSHRPNAPLFAHPRTQILPLPATRNLHARPPRRRRMKHWLFRLLGRPVLP